MFKSEVIEDNDIFQKQISQFQSSFLQSVNWSEFKKIYGWDNIKILFKKENEVLGFTIILVRKIKFFRFFYIPRGPIIEDRYLEAALSQIEKIAKSNKASVLKIEPDLLDSEKYIQYFRNYKKTDDFIQPVYTALIDLSKTKEELIKNIPSKKRGRIKNKFNLVFEETDNINDFFTVYKNNAENSNFKSRDIDYFQNLLKQFKGGVKMFKVLYEKEIISASFNIIYKNHMTYLYSGSNKKYNNMYPGYFLVFNTMLWGSEQNIKSYDLWGISEENKSWEGFSEFKLNIGGSPFKFLGSFDLYINPLYAYIYKFKKGKMQI